MRRARFAAAALLAAALAAGCGIRPTEGPVSAGDPASRPPQPTAADGDRSTHVIFLVRDGRLQPVERSEGIDLRQPGPAASPPAIRVEQVDRLLRELAVGPTATEARAGWTTRVPGGGVRALAGTTDPPGVVRLDVTLDQLDQLTLGQIVCTMQRAAGTDSVLMAGRRGSAEPMRCDRFLTSGPTSASPAPATGGPTVN